MGNPNPLDPCTRSFMQCDNPCHDPSNPCKGKQPDQIDTFITQFFGPVGKSAVNGAVVWSLPCGLDVGTANNPIMPGESLACYFLRLFEAGVAGQTGMPGAPGFSGLPGADAFSYTQQDFDQPSLAAPYINILLTPSASLIPGLFYQIDTSGFYQLQNINPDGSSLFTLIQPQAGAPTVIPSGVAVVASGMPGIRVQGPKGPKGLQGLQGPQKTASTVTTAPFNKPASVGQFINIQVAYNPLSAVFSTVYVQVAGDGSQYQVASSDTLGNMTLQLVADAGGPTLQPAGSTVTMCGALGPAGTPGQPVSLISGSNGFVPVQINGNPPGYPNPVFNQFLNGVYLAIGTTLQNTPQFTTPFASYNPHIAANYNGTFLLIFKCALNFVQNSPTSGVSGGLWVKVVDSVSGDVPATEHKTNYVSNTNFSGWTYISIPIIVTNNTGLSRNWRLYCKSTLSGGNGRQDMAILGLCGVQWIKML